MSLTIMYFQDRQGRVKLATVNSSWYDVHTRKGCPQGSCFGPLLGNIFQNELSYSVMNYDFSLYTDNHQICASHHLIDNIVTLNKEAEILCT